MARPLTGMLPEELWYPNRKQDAIRFLQGQPAPPTTRRDWLFQWALWVGVKLSRADYDKVQEGAI